MSLVKLMLPKGENRQEDRHLLDQGSGRLRRRIDKSPLTQQVPSGDTDTNCRVGEIFFSHRIQAMMVCIC